MQQKRLVTIQDVSCFGKCSCTVALPVVSAMGIECAAIPTAVLSTHTGGFKGYTFRDLTGDIRPIADHWASLGLKFDAIYTGYLGSKEQIDLVCEFFDRFATKDTLIFADPAMADNGQLYNGFADDFPKGMARVCSKANVIVPNLTEAALMLGEEFRPAGTYDEAYIHGLLKRLTGLGCPQAVVTGVIYDKAKQGAVGYDSRTDTYCEYFRENIPHSYHGTGDVYAASMAGAMTLGFSLAQSIKIAVDYTVEAIHCTEGDENSWYGVKFELAIPQLIKEIGELGKSGK